MAFLQRNRMLYLNIAGLTGPQKQTLLDFLTVEHQKNFPNNDVYYRLNQAGTKAKVKIMMTPALIQAYQTHPKLQAILISHHDIDDLDTVRQKDREAEWDYEP